MRHQLVISGVFGLAACAPVAVDTDIPAFVDDTDAVRSGERTLETCATTVGDGVPSFYATFFRCVDLSVDGDELVIATDDLPPHRSYYYGSGSPNYEDFDTSRGEQYHPNPGTIAESRYTLRVPRQPAAGGTTITAATVDGVVNTSDDEYPMGPAGVALDSVILFNPMAAPGDDIEDEKYTFDSYNAHPAGTTYHYHTASPGPLEVTAFIEKPEVTLYGLMCDGSVVMGCTELDGVAPSGLDAQGGHVGDLVSDGTTWLSARYHVHVCPEGGRKYTPEIRYYGSCANAGGPP